MFAEAASDHDGRTAAETLPEGIVDSVNVTLIGNQHGFVPSLSAGQRPAAMDGGGFVDSGHDTRRCSERRTRFYGNAVLAVFQPLLGRPVAADVAKVQVAGATPSKY